MKPIKLLAVALAVAFVSSPALALQDPNLVELAKKEKKRRKAVQGPATTVTEDDLKTAGKGAAVRSPGSSAPYSSEAPASVASSAKPSGSPEKTEEQERSEKGAELQKRMDEQRKRIEFVRKEMAEAQAELNDTANQTLGGRRAALLKLLDDGKVEIARSEQTMGEIEDEARRAGLSVSR